MEIGNIKDFDTIEKFCQDNDFSFYEYGEELIGEHFIVCKANSEDRTISFIYDNWNISNGSVYKCIYCD